MIAFVASLGIAAVTLGIFSARQLRGPEGTLHRFMMAIGERDAEAINRLTKGTPEEKLYTAAFAQRVLLSGGKYQVVDVNQVEEKNAPVWARVGVLFRFPDGREMPWLVTVARVDRNWYINTKESMRPGPMFLNQQ